MSNLNLNFAKQNKNDEFYTLFEDIENNIEMIKEKLEGKIVYSPCDNPRESNFYKYFKENFKRLKLKRFYCSFLGIDEKPYLTIIEGDKEETKPLITGDFLSDECIEIIKKADIIITNPPFSLLAKFLELIVSKEKDFLLIGNINIVTHSTLSQSFIKRNIHIWHYGKSMYFKVPSSYELSSKAKIFEGEKCIKVSVAKWISSFENPYPIDDFINSIKNNSYHQMKHKYQEIHNINALNVNNLNEIPFDYKGVLAVPCTMYEFLGEMKNPIFEVLGQSSKNGYVPSVKYENPIYHYSKGGTQKGTKGYNFTIHHHIKPTGGYFVCDNHKGYFKLLYKRILIRNRLLND